ncbi:hypothetical protein ACYPKM_02435 [Pseudomonas aeruginosa]
MLPVRRQNLIEIIRYTAENFESCRQEIELLDVGAKTLGECESIKTVAALTGCATEPEAVLELLRHYLKGIDALASSLPTRKPYDPGRVCILVPKGL